MGTDQSRTEFPGMSVTVNQSETEFDDVIISDWPSVIIWLLIGAGRWQIDLALMQVLYNIYIQYFSMTVIYQITLVMVDSFLRYLKVIRSSLQSGLLY